MEELARTADRVRYVTGCKQLGKQQVHQLVCVLHQLTLQQPPVPVLLVQTPVDKLRASRGQKPKKPFLAGRLPFTKRT